MAGDISIQVIYFFYQDVKHLSLTFTPFLSFLGREFVPSYGMHSETSSFENDNFPDVDRFELSSVAVRTRCKFCDHVFDTDEELKYHLKTLHADRYFAFCEECGKGFVSSNGYKDHMSMIHNKEKSNHCCHLCGKYFSSNSRLLLHLRSHSEENNFTCHLCLRSYKHKKNLKDHTCRPMGFVFPK